MDEIILGKSKARHHQRVQPNNIRPRGLGGQQWQGTHSKTGADARHSVTYPVTSSDLWRGLTRRAEGGTTDGNISRPNRRSEPHAHQGNIESFQHLWISGYLFTLHLVFPPTLSSVHPCVCVCVSVEVDSFSCSHPTVRRRKRFMWQYCITLFEASSGVRWVVAINMSLTGGGIPHDEGEPCARKCSFILRVWFSVQVKFCWLRNSRFISVDLMITKLNYFSYTEIRKIIIFF